jgi:hypothetical protein
MVVLSIIISGLSNGDLRIKSDAYCRCARRRFRNALLFIAVENNREGAARGQPGATWSFPVESTEPGEPFDLDHFALTARDRAGSRLRQNQRKR